MVKFKQTSKKDLEKELYISTLIGSLRNNVSADIAFSLANNLLLYLHTSRPNPQIIDRDKIIKEHLSDSHDIKVVSIDALSSINKLPQKIGDYAVTEDIIDSAAKFIQNDSGNHYLVHTTNSSKIFIIRTNARDKKVLQTKDLLKIIDGFYTTFQQGVGNASGLLFSTESGMAEDMKTYRGKLHEDNRGKFISSVYIAKKQLTEAKNSLNKLGKSTLYYHERAFSVQEGFDTLRSLHETSEGIEKRINELPLFHRPKFFNHLQQRQSRYR